ncbi:MAG: energy-coupling factor transporter ATPase [Clostridia bacterium]|nr:energy-coupling factor transporter ATPase [Clostridia bacterium]
MPIVKIENVSFTYGRKTPYEIHALDSVNIAIEENLITGIIGHTGSGKSTLVQMFNGLIRPDSGSVIIDGENIWDKPKQIGKIRFKVGMVMQYPEYQLFAETVKEDIAYGPKNMGLDDEEINRRIEKSARFCGLDFSVLEKSPFDLSGGQKRRVALAGVMAMEPKLLVLDEPAAGLDPRGRREILGGIKEYQRQSGNSVVIVSHSMEDMAMYCDRIIVMANGRIILEGTPAEVFSQASVLQSAGLDVPEVTKIVTALRRRGVKISSDIYTIQGALEAIAKCASGGEENVT